MANAKHCVPEEGKEDDMDTDTKALLYRIHSIIKGVALETQNASLYNQADYCVYEKVLKVLPVVQKGVKELMEGMPFTATIITAVIHEMFNDKKFNNGRMVTLFAYIGNQYRLAWTPSLGQELDGELTTIVRTMVTLFRAYLSDWDRDMIAFCGGKSPGIPCYPL